MKKPTTPAPKKTRRNAPQWEPKFAIDVFVLAASGASDKRIAQSLGVKPERLQAWTQEYPELAYALETAKARREKGPNGEPPEDTLEGYVFGHLSPRAQEIWNELEFLEDADDALPRIAELFSKDTTGKMRKQLLMHAIVKKTFDVSAALNMVGVSKKEFQRWMEFDPDFAELWEEVTFHKKNFFESGLLSLVKARNPLAVIFANKTINSDRGYGEKLKVDVSGTINVQHTMVPLFELGLPFEVRKQVVEAMESWKAKQAEKLENSKAISLNQ